MVERRIKPHLQQVAEDSRRAEQRRLYRRNQVFGLLIVAALAAIAIFPPSRLLGFQEVPHFDAAFALMVAGMLATLPINVVAGESYWSCACGRSKAQPFCDGSHKGTEFRPQEWKATSNEEFWFCTCKRSQHQPMCDGSHKAL